MDQERRKIIVKEIEYWRNNRLLADQYCDFLLNLYKENDDGSINGAKSSFRSIAAKGIGIWLLVFGIITICIISLFNFNSFHPILQISISSLIVIALGIYGFRRRRRAVLFNMVMGIAALFMLFIGEYLLQLHLWNDAIWTVGYLMICGVIWLVIGIAAVVILLHICGWLGLLLSYGWFIYTRLDDLTWITLELAWLPLSFLFVWLGWLMMNKSRTNSSVFVLVGIVLWFLPEVYGIALTELDQVLLQGLFICKLLVAGAILFATRNKWIDRTI